MDSLAGRKLILRNQCYYAANNVLKRTEVIVYYFNASHVTQFPELTQVLKEVYAEIKERKARIEVIYVPCDSDEEEFKKDYSTKHGPWYCVPFEDQITRDQLKFQYNVSYIPSLVVVNARTGEIISCTGREDLLKLGVNVIVVWSKPTII